MLGFDYLLLLPDTTGLLQPVDVGVGKGLKGKIRSIFHDFILKNYKKRVNKNNVVKWTFKNPTKNLIVEWAIRSMAEVKDFKLFDSKIAINTIINYQ
jgi:hypothetical protein